MSPALITFHGAVAALAVFVSTATAAEQNAAGQDSVVPLIVIDDVPLLDAIKNVARQMNLNYILDPRVPGSSLDPGRQMAQPAVSGRWTNLTAQAALSNVLAQHRLAMVSNPATSVARIAPAYRAVQPVPMSQVGTNASAPIPLLITDDVSLSEAIRKLAGAAQLDVTLDPKVRNAPAFDPGGIISFRWEKITARQALVALLDNFDLVLVEDSGQASWRITPRTQETKP